MNGQFSNFCTVFVAHFVDESDEMARFQRLARLIVEEITRPCRMLRYTADDALQELKRSIRPILEQEALWAIAPAFFGSGGVCREDVELLLQELATFIENPDGYQAPTLASP